MDAGTEITMTRNRNQLWSKSLKKIEKIFSKC